MADPFDSLISSSAAGTLMAGANMFGQQRAQNLAIQDRAAARDQGMLQFMLERDSRDMAVRESGRQFDLGMAREGRLEAAQREESAFARLNSSLDRQLKVAELESQERQQAFDNTLKAMSFGLDAKAKAAQVRTMELQTRRFENLERFQSLLPRLDALKLVMENGDNSAKSDAATEYKLLLQQNTDALGVAPQEARRMLGETALLASSLTKPVFKVLDDGNQNIDPAANIEFIKYVDVADGVDADELQIGSTLLQGFRGKKEAETISEYRAATLAHLNGVFNAEPGKNSVAAEEFVNNVFKDGNSAGKFIDLMGRGAFYRPLSSEEILSVRAYRAELENDARKQDMVLRASGLMSDPEVGKYIANRDLKNARLLKEHTMRLKGARDPEAVAFTEGSNVVTVDGIMTEVLAHRVPQYVGGKIMKGASTVTSGLLAPISGGATIAVPAAVRSFNLSNMQTDFRRFKQEFPEAVRSNPALLHDPKFFANWNARVDTIVDELGAYFDPNVIREQLSFGKNLPSWVVSDRDLVPLASRIVPGYKDAKGNIVSMESPTLALGRYFRSQYATLEQQAGAAVDRTINSAYGPRPATDYFEPETTR